jgi:type II secretory pathway component PulJ
MRRRQAFSLVDTLLAVSLLGTFSLLAFRLVDANFHLVQATLAADSNTARFDRALQQLRTDVEASSALQMPQSGLLRIRLAGNQTVDWQSESSTLTRRGNGEVRSWTVGQPIELKLDGAVALLAISPIDKIAMAAHSGGPK